MKILCLSKRRPQGRDLFTQPYGRFYHLPRLLAERGHEVHLLLASYKNEPAVYRSEGNLHVHSVSVLPRGPWSFWRKAASLTDVLGPDWIIGFSDICYGILAQRLAASRGARCLIDAYDNYESYIPWAKPLHSLWRRVMAQADVVTAAGPQLAEWMRGTSGRSTVEVLPMAADPAFKPMDKLQCRQKLGLPVHGTLLGYAGSLHSSRGVELLFETFERMRAIVPDCGLVISGRSFNRTLFPAGVHSLGYRPAEDVPLILNSVDLLFVVNKPGAFGDFSYPAKLYEAMACGIPVVAADVPGTAWILRDHPEMLARTGDVEDFVSKALRLMGSGRVDYECGGWEGVAEKLERLLG